MPSRFPRRRGAYYHYNGRRYVSVTNVLKSLAKPALTNWAARTAAQAIFDDPYEVDTVNKAVSAIYKTRDRAGQRGSDAHAYAERVAKEYPEKHHDLGDLVGGPGFAVLSFFDTMKPKAIFTEVNLYNDTHGYAGTADLIAKIADKTWLVDYKTSKAVYPEMGLQLAAYANAEFYLSAFDYGLEDDAPLDIPQIDATAVVLLRPDGHFTWTPLEGDFEVFLSLKKVWEWANE